MSELIMREPDIPENNCLASKKLRTRNGSW
jgi:hypothetical protein